LHKTGALNDKEGFLEDVLNRESISTTGIGNGIAIPHGKSANVLETTVAIGRTAIPLEWESLDDKPVHFIALLAVNEEDKTGVHVKLLSQMARKLASEDTCKRLLKAATAEEIADIFSE
jgi:PTS system fructose-specific IIA component